MTETDETPEPEAGDELSPFQADSVQESSAFATKTPALIVDERSKLNLSPLPKQAPEGMREEVATEPSPALEQPVADASAEAVTDSAHALAKPAEAVSPVMGRPGCAIGVVGLVVSVVAIVFALFALNEVRDLRARLITPTPSLTTAQPEEPSAYQPPPTETQAIPTRIPTLSPVFEPILDACRGVVRMTETQLLTNVGDYNSAILTLKMNHEVNVTAISSTNADWVRVFINSEVYGWIPRGHIEIPSLCRLPEL